jgi:gamma-glutamyltranspeptidase/glutathione hydrolase
MSDFKFKSRRSPVISTGGMVATSQPLAVAAGLEILKLGGNAADAAVATAAALNVTEPTSTGLGGDCFALFFEASSGRVSALNGSGRAPAALTLERLRREGFDKELPALHPYTITVPGACAGWCDLVERHGSLPMSDILTPAIRLAESGFPVAPVTAHFWQRGATSVLSSAPGGLELTIDGRGPQPGEIFRNPGLRRTFLRIAEGGKAAFYQGEIAEAIASTVQAAGGCLSEGDLAAHTSTWDQPISIDYRGVRIWECPPNGQGLAALLALNILEGYDLTGRAALSAERLHLEIEALRLAFADASWYVADPAFQNIPLGELTSKEYAAERRKAIRAERATVDHHRGTPDVHSPNPAAASDTVYLSVVDEHGNACSFINSNYRGFGTGIVPSGWGFTLQNRGQGFSLEAGHPNALAPGKRPYHTIIPAMATRPNAGEGAETLFASFGVMGGYMQPQGHVQVTVALVDDGLDPQAALDRPRFCIQEGLPGGTVLLEEGISSKTRSALTDMGHEVTNVRGYNRSVFGRGQIIQRDAVTGASWGGSDPRADGCAMTT